MPSNSRIPDIPNKVADASLHKNATENLLFIHTSKSCVPLGELFFFADRRRVSYLLPNDAEIEGRMAFAVTGIASNETVAFTFETPSVALQKAKNLKLARARDVVLTDADELAI